MAGTASADDSSPGAIPEMLSFIQNTGIARILPAPEMDD